MHFCNTRKHTETAYSKYLVQLGNYTVHLLVCTSPSSSHHSILLTNLKFWFSIPSFLSTTQFWLAYPSAGKLSSFPLSKQSTIQLSTTLFPSKRLAKQSLENYKASPKSPGIKTKHLSDRNLYLIFASTSCQKGRFYSKITIYYFEIKLSYFNYSECQRNQEIIGFIHVSFILPQISPVPVFSQTIICSIFFTSTPLVIVSEVSHYLFKCSSHSGAEDSAHTTSVGQMLLKRNTKYKLLSIQLHGLNWQLQLQEILGGNGSTAGAGSDTLTKELGLIIFSLPPSTSPSTLPYISETD